MATALWNQDERDRIIAIKAYELSCSCGCEHGCDMDDGLGAEQELSSAVDNVLVTRSDAGFDISIVERAQQEQVSVHLPYAGNASEQESP